MAASNLAFSLLRKLHEARGCPLSYHRPGLLGLNPISPETLCQISCLRSLKRSITSVCFAGPRLASIFAAASNYCTPRTRCGLLSSQIPISLRCELNGRCVAKAPTSLGPAGSRLSGTGRTIATKVVGERLNRVRCCEEKVCLLGARFDSISGTPSSSAPIHLLPALLAVEGGSPCPPPRRTPLRDAVCDS